MAKDYLPHTPWSRRIDRAAEPDWATDFFHLGGAFLGLSWQMSCCAYVLTKAEVRWRSCSGTCIPLGSCLAWVTPQADAHIRVDVLHERFRHRTKAWIELYGILLLLLPFIALVLI